jgi:hypothetical protein
MKKMMFSVFVFCTLSTSVFAFIPQMNFYVNREVATARVWNTSGYPIVCSGNAFGQTFSGMTYQAWLNQVYIAPGVFAEAYVYTNFYDPFVNSWAQIDCQFTW